MSLRVKVSGIDPERVRIARRDAGLSQKELAERIGCSPRAIQNWESPRDGARQPHPRFVRSLAQATEKPIAWFFIDAEQVA